MLSEKFLAVEVALREVGAHTPGLEWWAFGSNLRAEKAGLDFDILLVYSSLEDLAHGKSCVASLELLFVIDLICMTPDEVAETRFISEQRCRRLMGSGI